MSDERLHEKLDKIVNDIADIKVTNAIQTEQLKEHIRRSDLLEIRVEQVDKRFDPIEEFVKNTMFLGKVAAWVLGSLTAIGGVIKWFFSHYS